MYDSPKPFSAGSARRPPWGVIGLFARTLRHRLGGLVEDGEKHPPGLRGERVDEGARRRRAGHACRALCARPEPERELLELFLPGPHSPPSPRPSSRPWSVSRTARSNSSGSFPRRATCGVAGKQFWLGPQPGRDDGALLGQRRRHPPHGRRRTTQDPALAPQHPRPRPAASRRRHRSRTAAAASNRTRHDTTACQRHRRDRRLRPTRRLGPHPRPPHLDDPRLGNHARDRARRPEGPNPPQDHHQAPADIKSSRTLRTSVL